MASTAALTALEAILLLTWDVVVAFAPELSTVSPVIREAVLAYVNTALNVANFGGASSPKLKLARLYLTAHLCTMAQRRGIAGPVSSESAGGISVSYAGAAIAGSQYSATGYGQMYLSIVKSTPARGGTYGGR